jgi:hypothetical protein
MTLRILAFVVLLTSVAMPLAAQDKPDFSESWILESALQPTGETPKALTISQSVARTNVRGEPMNPFFKDITVTRMLDGGEQSETYLIGVVSGFMTGTAVARPNTHRRVIWEEQALVIENGSFTGRTPETGEWTERREVFSLDSDGRLRIAITTRSPVDISSSAILLYRRR